MIAERLALRGRKDAVFLVLLVAIPAAALCLIGAIRAPSLLWAGVLIGAFHTFTNGVIVMPSIVISSIGGASPRARLVAAHPFVQAVFAYPIGPVLVPVLPRSPFGRRLGPSTLIFGVVVLPV